MRTRLVLEIERVQTAENRRRALLEALRKAESIGKTIEEHRLLEVFEPQKIGAGEAYAEGG